MKIACDSFSADEKFKELTDATIAEIYNTDNPSSFMSQLGKLGIHHLDPYGYDSYETYYAELDKRKSEVADEVVKALLEKYKARVMELNQKGNWSILKYIGENTDTQFGLTKGRYYYWPCSKERTHIGVLLMMKNTPLISIRQNRPYGTLQKILQAWHIELFIREKIRFCRRSMTALFNKLR